MEDNYNDYFAAAIGCTLLFGQIGGELFGYYGMMFGSIFGALHGLLLAYENRRQ